MGLWGGGMTLGSVVLADVAQSSYITRQVGPGQWGLFEVQAFVPSYPAFKF